MTTQQQTTATNTNTRAARVDDYERFFANLDLNDMEVSQINAPLQSKLKSTAYERHTLEFESTSDGIFHFSPPCEPIAENESVLVTLAQDEPVSGTAVVAEKVLASSSSPPPSPPLLVRASSSLSPQTHAAKQNSGRKVDTLCDNAPIVRHIYAIQNANDSKLFRIGPIEYLHRYQAGSDLHSVYCAVPTLHFTRDMRIVYNHFKNASTGNGWYRVFDHEVRFFLENYILPQFNRDIIDLYRQYPNSTPIPPSSQMLII